MTAVIIELRDLEKQMHAAVSVYKSMMAAYFGNRNMAVKHYSELALVRNANEYGLPNKRIARAAALPGLISGIQRYSLNHPLYSVEWLTGVSTRYNALLSQTMGATIDIACTTISKSQLRQQIDKILRSIIKLIEAHYPDNYTQKLREFGFLRETY